MNAREIAWLVIIGILLAGVGFLGYKTISDSKRIKSQETIIYALQHPKVTVTVRHDSIVVKEVVKYRPYPVEVRVVDSIPYPVQGTVSWYDSSYRKDGARFRWKAKVLGEIDEIAFSDLVFPKDIVTIVTHVDTCITKPPAHLPKNHIMIDFNLSGMNFKQMPNVEAVFGWSIKDKIKLNFGTEYSFYHSELYGKAGIGVFIR